MKKIQPHHFPDGSMERRVVETDPDLAGMSWDKAVDLLQRPKAGFVIHGEVPPQAVEQLTARIDPAAQAEMMDAIEATMFFRTAGGTPYTFHMHESESLGHSVVFAPPGTGMGVTRSGFDFEFRRPTFFFDHGPDEQLERQIRPRRSRGWRRHLRRVKAASAQR